MGFFLLLPEISIRLHFSYPSQIRYLFKNKLLPLIIINVLQRRNNHQLQNNVGKAYN